MHALAQEAVKGMAQIFSSADDDPPEAQPPKPIGTTLSSMLTGREGAGFSHAQGTNNEKVCISRLPRGITESAVRLESARHGAVTSVIMEENGTTAYITYAAGEMAAAAVRRLSGRSGLFGGLAIEPVQVRLTNE